eukprot:6187602-Pleurochrysis_carterae.AAC.5
MHIHRAECVHRVSSGLIYAWLVAEVVHSIESVCFADYFPNLISQALILVQLVVDTCGDPHIELAINRFDWALDSSPEERILQRLAIGRCVSVRTASRHRDLYEAHRIGRER